jgi:hypothetical protein
MRVEVDEPALAHAATVVESIGAAVAAVRLAHLAAAIALAMPGSVAAAAAVRAATALDEATSALVRDLAQHTESLREATRRYDDTDEAVTSAARRLGVA